MRSLILPHCRLTVHEEAGDGLQQKLREQSLTVSFRKGGEKFHPSNRQHSQSLKKLFQEAGIPPWIRDSIPLLYLGDELIAVCGLWVAKKYVVAQQETGWSASCSGIDN